MRRLRCFRRKLINRIKAISGAVDVHIHQRLDEPTIALDMDRTQLQSMGISPNRRAEYPAAAVREPADPTRFLAQSGQQGRLQHAGADAAVPDQFTSMT